MSASSISVSRLIHEAMAGVTQRSSRSSLTIIGTALGIGSFIAVLGVTSTANAQIGKDFDEKRATQISVQLVDDSGSQNPAFPPDAEQSALDLTGARAAGVSWDIQVDSVRSLPGYLDQEAGQSRVMAASAGYWNVVQPTVSAGRTFDDALHDQPVAVVGQQLAKSLNIADVRNSPTVFVNGHALTVIGVVSDTRRNSTPLGAITIPADYARRVFGPPGTAESLTVETALGASRVVARQLALAIDSRHPDAFKVMEPPDPTVVRDQVNNSVQALFYALALICLLVGAVGITNASLIGVISRIPEIGLRRSLGALPRHIAAQFLLESAIRGLLGGAVGANLGLVAVTLVALSQQWTAVVQPWTIVAAPFVGAMLGILAGLYPAFRASKIEPVEAFRR